MIKSYFTSLFIVFFSFSFSQNFPDLNASTGNFDEYPVDKDTNIYMFQGSRLTKTDKNFNVIWSNVYSGINFTNLLLSKTGSMYFLAGTSYPSKYFGKIDPNGSLAWIKSVSGLMATISGTVFTANNPDCLSLLLDAGNNLLISGNMYLGGGPNGSTTYILKCDTNGAPLKFKPFRMDFGMDLVILNDSAGVYKLMGSGNFLGGTIMGIYSYSDVSDSFVKYGSIAGFGCTTQASPAYWQFSRSKINSRSFYIFAMATTTAGFQYNGIVKATDNAQVKWVASVQASPMGPYQFYKRMEEDNKGNVFASITCGPACSSYTSAFVRIDSNGVRDPYFSKMLNGYPIGSSFPYQIPNNSPRVIHENNYYFDVWGYSFPGNPLTVQRYNSSLVLPCASTLSAINNCVTASNFGWSITGTIVPVSSYTLGVISTTVTPSAFSVNQNFCTVVGLENNSHDNSGIEIYPNPVNDRLHIESEQTPEKVQIFDLNGKVIKSLGSTKDISVADLQPGIYFIRIKTDKGESNKKFIKE